MKGNYRIVQQEEDKFVIQVQVEEKISGKKFLFWTWTKKQIKKSWRNVDKQGKLCHALGYVIPHYYKSFKEADKGLEDILKYPIMYYPVFKA